jgi:hypothetical protein
MGLHTCRRCQVVRVLRSSFGSSIDGPLITSGLYLKENGTTLSETDSPNVAHLEEQRLKWQERSVSMDPISG